MRAQRIKMDLRRIGDGSLKISAAVAMMSLAFWLFAPASWFSGKTAAVVALFVMPAGLVLYWLTWLLARSGR